MLLRRSHSPYRRFWGEIPNTLEVQASSSSINSSSRNYMNFQRASGRPLRLLFERGETTPIFWEVSGALEVQASSSSLISSSGNSVEPPWTSVSRLSLPLSLSLLDVEATCGTTLDLSRLGKTTKREDRSEVRSAKREERIGERAERS